MRPFETGEKRNVLPVEHGLGHLRNYESEFHGVAVRARIFCDARVTRDRLKFLNPSKTQSENGLELFDTA